MSIEANSPKLAWIRPTVRTLQAGAAETGPSNNEDGDFTAS